MHFKNFKNEINNQTKKLQYDINNAQSVEIVNFSN